MESNIYQQINLKNDIFDATAVIYNTFRGIYATKLCTFARLASESNFALASEDLHSPGGENMQNENHLSIGSLIWFCMWTKLFLRRKKASAEGASRQILLNYLKSKYLISNFRKIMFLTVNFTLARLASDFKFKLANRKIHSPWRVWRVLISTPVSNVILCPLLDAVTYILFRF